MILVKNYYNSIDMILIEANSWCNISSWKYGYNNNIIDNRTQESHLKMFYYDYTCGKRGFCFQFLKFKIHLHNVFTYIHSYCRYNKKCPFEYFALHVLLEITVTRNITLTSLKRSVSILGQILFPSDPKLFKYNILKNIWLDRYSVFPKLI